MKTIPPGNQAKGAKQVSLVAAQITAILAVAFPLFASAASVTQISSDSLGMQRLGQPYIHSQYSGSMPYWGPCERCQEEPVNVPSQMCATDTQGVPLAQWTSSGQSSCGSYEEDTFEAIAKCVNNGEVGLEILNTSYDPGASVSQKNYNLSAEYTLDNGLQDVTGSAAGSCSGNTGVDTDFTCNYGGNSCSQNFDWYPSITVDGTASDGTFVGSVTFTNYLSPSQEQSKTFHIEFSNYKTQEQLVCQQYYPTSTECLDTANTLGEDNAPTYQFPCGTHEQGWNNPDCTTSLNGAQFIFGAPDGATGTAQSGYSVMQATYDNPTSVNMPATLNFAADNYGWVWIDGSQVGFTQGFNSTDSENVLLPPGNVTITFLVMNYPNCAAGATNCPANPAAGILTLQNSAGQTLLSTNSNLWTLIKSPPTAPNPSMQSLLPAGYTPVNCFDHTC